MQELEKKVEDFERLFSLIPLSLTIFKYLENEHENILNYEKKNRYIYLSNILKIGIESYFNLKTNQNPDFYYCAEPSFLFHFENLNQLNEWIISGLNLKHQNLVFTNDSSSEEDFIDSP